MNVPAWVGVPLIVIVLFDQEALTPAGKPVAVPMPVAPVVLWVIFVVNPVLIHNVGVFGAALTVFFPLIIMVCFAVSGEQSSIPGITYKMVTLPSFFPITLPILFTTALVVSFISHLPLLLFSFNAITLSIHTSSGPVILTFSMQVVTDICSPYPVPLALIA